MKIGIFGGSFNPPHDMHKNIALKLIKCGYLDRIIYVPTGDKYNKRDLIDFEDRFNMLKLMIKDNKVLSVSNVGNDDDYQYTYQVLDYFNNSDDDIYFICGLDNLLEFYTWKEYEYILENYKLLVIRRDGNDIDEILKRYREYINNIIITVFEPVFLSSTYIRNNINDCGVSEYLDEDVYDYIKKNNLYGIRQSRLIRKMVVEK